MNDNILDPRLSGSEVVPMPPDALAEFASPLAGIARAQVIANTLADVIRKQKLAVRIGDKDHIRIEGWMTLGAMCGVTAATVETKQDEEGFWARAEVLRLSNGERIGSADSRCDWSERNWANRDGHALLSMAQTRAASKALAQVLRWVVVLAGYSGTPAEEMPDKGESGDLTAGTAMTRIEPKPVAPPSVEWLDQEIQFGKWKGKTWRYMSEGSIDGERQGYLTWMVGQPARDARQKVTQARARVLLEGYEAQRRAANAKFEGNEKSPEWDLPDEQPPLEAYENER